jgi:hypothetical protein
MRVANHVKCTDFIVYELVIVYAHLDSAGAVRNSYYSTTSVYLRVVGGDELMEVRSLYSILVHTCMCAGRQ